jgi:guanylate kinase
MRELEEDGMGYWFVSREEMEHDVRDHQFLECGEHNGHLYGTKLDTIRTIIRQGKMCVLDCSPQVRNDSILKLKFVDFNNINSL